MIKANLPTFFVILMLMVCLVWLMFNWSYGSILASKNSQIELQDRQLSDYREKLKGATPEQAKEKVETLERTIKMMVGSRWEPLTKAQISTLVLKLREIPKSRAQIMYENGFGKDLAQTIFEAFQQAGWDQAWLSTGSGLGDGIVTGWGTRGIALKEALDATVKHHVWVKDPDKNILDLVIVGVGINPD